MRSGDIWVSDYNRYRLVRYSLAGEPADSLQQQPRWFPGGEPLRMGGPHQPRPPHMIGNWIGAQNNLWTLVAQPRQEWCKAWDGIAQNTGAAEVRAAALPPEYKLFNTLIEVIDTGAKRVIARHTFEGYVIAILPEQRVASFIETDLGVPILQIDRLTLLRPQD